MADIFFSSDHHFFHERIIGYANRPFHTVGEMNECMIERHNEIVRSQDHIYFLGDVTMLRDNQGRGLGILRRMNGHKRLIMGNHDHYAMKFYLEHFEKVMAMNVIGGLRFTHIPVHPISMGNVLGNVHGHIHQNDSPHPVMWIDRKTQKLKVQPYINISVEVTGYRPVNLDWLIKEAKRLSDEGEESKPDRGRILLGTEEQMRRSNDGSSE